VMIGRGAQGQPWVVGQIAAGLGETTGPVTPSGAELTDLVIEHYEGVLSEYGVQVGVRAARKHLDWYLEAANLDVGKDTHKQLLESLDPAQVISLTRSIFADDRREAA